MHWLEVWKGWVVVGMLIREVCEVYGATNVSIFKQISILIANFWWSSREKTMFVFDLYNYIKKKHMEVIF